MTFTPGPWHRTGTMVYALNDKGLNRFDARVQDAFCPYEELEANARLISKAPEMYAMLRDIFKESLDDDIAQLLQEIDGEEG